MWGGQREGAREKYVAHLLYKMSNIFIVVYNFGRYVYLRLKKVDKIK